MAAADELCDRIALLVDGAIAVIESPRVPKLRHAKRIARVTYHDGDGDGHSDGEALVSEEFELEDERQRLALAERIRAHPIETIHTQEPSLEDVFLELTGRRLG